MDVRDDLGEPYSTRAVTPRPMTDVSSGDRAYGTWKSRSRGECSSNRPPLLKG